MKAVEAIKALFGMTRMSEQEVQDALASNREYRWRTRLPETPDATVKYLSFTGHYRLEHPDVTHLEVHDAAMKAHPEWWPNTLPQPPKPDYDLEPAYNS